MSAASPVRGDVWLESFNPQVGAEIDQVVSHTKAQRALRFFGGAARKPTQPNHVNHVIMSKK